MKELEEQTDSVDCKPCLRNNPLFEILNEEELDRLDQTSVEVVFKKGEVIYKQGTPLTHMVILHSGFGKICIEGSKGKSLILSYAKKFEINGGVGFFIDKIHHSSLIAASDCKTCLIDVKLFNEVMRSNNAFMEVYMREYAGRVRQIYHQFAVLTQKNMEGRMAEAILYLKTNVAENDTIKNISKSDLAEYTAMSKESAIRVLKGFKDAGYVTTDNQDITIVDEPSLYKIAQNG